MKLASPASILLTTLLLLPTGTSIGVILGDSLFQAPCLKDIVWTSTSCDGMVKGNGESTEDQNVTSSTSGPTAGQLTVTTPALTGQTETGVMITAPPGAQTSNKVTTLKPTANVSTTSVSEGNVSCSTSTMEPLTGHVTQSISTAGSDTTTHPEEHHIGFSVPSTSEPESTKEPVQTSADKRMLWCLVPVLGIVAAALAYGLKSKLRKGPTYPDTTENGTENASYQSRPENSKDGVMLLGVKSGGEDTAAAR